MTCLWCCQSAAREAFWSQSVCCLKYCHMVVAGFSSFTPPSFCPLVQNPGWCPQLSPVCWWQSRHRVCCFRHWNASRYLENKCNTSALFIFLKPLGGGKVPQQSHREGVWQFLVSSLRLVWEKVWLSCLGGAQKHVVVLEPVSGGFSGGLLAWAGVYINTNFKGFGFVFFEPA